MTCKLLSNDYIQRLKSWNELRASLVDKDALTICTAVNEYWLNCKLEKYYLHPVDIPEWPTPWELINDHVYCQYSRALGIIYTLMLLGIQDIDLVDVVYDNNENIPIVLVNNAKYLLNCRDDELLNSCSSNYTITRKYDIRPLREKAVQR